MAISLNAGYCDLKIVKSSRIVVPIEGTNRGIILEERDDGKLFLDGQEVEAGDILQMEEMGGDYYILEADEDTWMKAVLHRKKERKD